MLERYSYLKEELLKCIDAMYTIGSIPGCPCEELREKIQNNTFNLVVLGQFKRGKTSLINSLLGAGILPIGVVPLTSIATVLTYGGALRIKVLFNDGRTTEIKPESLHLYVTEKGNPGNEKNVSEVFITYPSTYLKDGVRLIDTPGVGSVYQHNTDAAYRYLPKCDAALFLLSVDQPLSKSEVDFLSDVREFSHRIFFLLNKVDYLSRKEIEESISFSEGVINDATGGDVTVFPVSAKLALEGKSGNSTELLEKSLLPSFEATLSNFLMREKGKVLILSVANNFLRTLSQAKLELELEMKAIAMPVRELKTKIDAFEKKNQDVMSEKRDFDFLLDGEVNRLVKTLIDEDLEKFKKDLSERMLAGIEGLHNESKKLSTRELNNALEKYVINEVRGSYNAWRSAEDDKIAGSFEDTCKRFILRINETVDSMLKFSSELFSIPFEAVKAETLWDVRSSLFYKFKDEPVGLDMLAASLTLNLPRFLGSRIVFKKMKEYTLQMIDMQGGRVRFDFTERLDKSKLDFRWEMLQRIEATIEGISTAIQKGLNEKNRGEKKAEEKKKTLQETLRRIEEIKTSLLKIKDSAEKGLPHA